MSNPNLNASRWAPGSSRSNNYQKSSYNNHSSPLPSTYRSRSISPAKPQSLLQPSSTTHQASHQSYIQSSRPLSKPQRDLQSRLQSLSKFTRLLYRLKWKSTTLMFSYRRVLHHITEERYHQQQHHQHDTTTYNELNAYYASTPLAYPLPARDSQTMFKIDFFEFYVLLERVLVYLLGVFAISVSAAHAVDISSLDGDGTRPVLSSSSGNVNGGSIGVNRVARENGATTTTLIGDSRTFTGHPHRFHANVLSALDTPSSPLHSILGTGIVRDYLGIAKEFRNRWKDVDEKVARSATTVTNEGVDGGGENGDVAQGSGVGDEDDDDETLRGSRYERLLKDLRVEEMVATILAAVEGAKGVAEEEVRRVQVEVINGVGGDAMMVEFDMGGMMGGDGEMWEAVADEMDMDMD